MKPNFSAYNNSVDVDRPLMSYINQYSVSLTKRAWHISEYQEGFFAAVQDKGFIIIKTGRGRGNKSISIFI